MNKTFKKIMALVLTVIMLMSVATVAFAASAEDDPSIPVSEVITTDPPAEEPHEHNSFFNLFIQFWLEIFNFFKYIFNDLLLGRPA